MLLNLIRNPYSKPILVMLLVALTCTANAQKPVPLFACSITGPTSVSYGSEVTFTLSGSCSATGWNVTCGTISTSNSTSVEVYFNGTCTSGTISTTNGVAAAHSVSITGVPATLNGGSISNTSQTINYNTTPSSISASAASGGSCSGSYSYQWYSSTNGSSYSAISGATGQNYQPGALTTTTYFKRLTTCGSSSAYTSNVATVTVYAQLIGGSVGSSQSINYNTTPSTLTLSGVSGGNGSYTYQWLYSLNGSSWTTISGATGTSYSPSALTQTTYYLVNVTSNGTTVGSNSATITVYGLLQGGSISPAAQWVNYNTAPSTLTLSGVSGGNGSYTYQWQSSPNSSFSSPTNVGSGGTTYSPGAITSPTFYRVAVTSNGVTAYSAIAADSVYAQLTGGSLSPSSQTINYNTTPSTLTLSGVSGGNGSYTYQWQSSPNSSFSSPTNVGSGGTTYSPGALTSTTYYRVAVTSNGVTAYSSTAKDSVYAQLISGTISPSSQTINYNTAPPTLTLSGTSGGNGSYTYQWMSSPNNSTWTAISGQTGASYSPSALTATTYYEVVVSSNGVPVTSAPITITVYPQLQAGSISPASQSINNGDYPASLNLSGVSGGNGSYTYQWMSSPDNSTWTAISGSTGTAYSPAAISSTTYYEVVVTSNGASVTTASAVITVYPTLQVGNINPGFQAINYNTAPSAMTVTGVSGGNGSYTYQWQWTADFNTWMTIDGCTGATCTLPAQTETIYVQVNVTSNGDTDPSNFAYIEVFPQLQGGTVSPATQTINYNTVPAPIVINDDASGGAGTATYAYQWQSSPNNSTWTNISGQTGKNYFPPALTATTYYRVAITSDGAVAYSSSATVNVYPQLQAGSVSPSTQTITSGSPASISLSGTSGGNGSYTYQWQSSFDNNSWANVNGQTATTYTPQLVSPGVYYRMAVTSNGVTAYTSSASVTVNEPLVGGAITGPSGTLGYNTSPGTLGSTQDAYGGSCYPGDYRYQWQYSTDGVNFYNLSGATSDTYTPTTPLTASIYFRRQVSCGTNTTNSNILYVQVTPQAQQNCTAPN